MRRRIEKIIIYWKDKRTLIYKDWIDALLGIITAIILPGITFCLVLYSMKNGHSFQQYSFPLLCMFLTGILDAINRSCVRTNDEEESNEELHKKQTEKIKLQRPKLFVRIAIDTVGLIISCSLTNTNINGLLWIPPLILCISGLLLLYDALKEIHLTISISYNTFFNK